MIRRGVNAVATACSTLGIGVSAALLVYMVAHVNVEIVLRSFFGRSTNSMSEYVGYALGAMVYLSLAHTLRSRKHVRVSLILALGRRRLSLWAELVCLAATFAVFAFAARYVWFIAQRDYMRGSVSSTLTQTPTWYIAAVVLAGIVFLLIQILSNLLDAVAEGVADEPPEGA